MTPLRPSSSISLIGGFMRTEFLEEFIVLARLCNYRRAAIELNVSQSVLSRHIQQVEAELGFKLFHRDGPTQLTAAGSEFLGTAQAMVRLYKEGVKRGRQACSQVVPVRLGITDRRTNFGGKRDLEAFLSSLDGLPIIRVRHSHVEDMLEDLRSNSVDVVIRPAFGDLLRFFEGGEDLALGSCAAGRLRQTMVVSAHGPLSRKELVTAGDLESMGFLVPNCTTGQQMFCVHANMLGLAATQGHPIFKQELLDKENILYLPIGYDEVYVGNYHELHASLAGRNDIVFVDRVDDAPFYMDVELVYRCDNDNPLIARFITAFESWHEGNSLFDEDE